LQRCWKKWGKLLTSQTTDFTVGYLAEFSVSHFESLILSRAAQALTEAGIRKLVVVGGTPATREELERLLAGKVELRLVDGTRHRPIERAKADLEWADRVLLWGATELHHKVSKQYADAPAAKARVVHVPRRGVAQLLSGAVESVRRAAR
jgi:hypothetical protein